MLENLLQMIKEVGQEQVVDNTDIPDDQNNAVMAEAAQSVTGGLQEAIANGQSDELMKMFSTGSSAQIMSNPVAQNIQGSFMDTISSKLGINKNVAAGLAATLIPIVISKLVKRTNSSAEADSGFNLNSLIGSLTGAGGNAGTGGFDIGGLISQFTGGGGQAKTGGGLMDIFSQLTNGAQEQKNSGGLSNLIQGFFGK
jgi:uncharacterized protein YidB (DUF937 family)